MSNEREVQISGLFILGERVGPRHDLWLLGRKRENFSVSPHFFATFSPPNRFLISSQKCVVDYLMYIGCLGDEILELGWRFGGQGDRGTGGPS